MGTMTSATPSMILRVSWLEAPLKAVMVAAGSIEEMIMPGNMPMTPKKVTPRMNTALQPQASHSLPARSMTRTPTSPARASTGSSHRAGMAR